MFITVIYCQIKQKKFEVLDRRMMFNGLVALMSVTGAVPRGRVPEHQYNGNQVRRRKKRGILVLFYVAEMTKLKFYEVL